MQLSQIMPKLKIVIFYLMLFLILFWISCQAGAAIDNSKLSWVYLFIGLSIFVMLPYINNKIGSFSLLCGVVFIYWVPLGSGLPILPRLLPRIQITELGMWMLFVMILIYNIISRNTLRKSTMSRYAFLPFSLFIGGSLITFLISEKYTDASYELTQIRISVLLPVLICFLCIYFIKTLEQAKKLLWVFLISAGLLGLINLFGPQTTDPSILLLVTKGSLDIGRIYRVIKLQPFDLLIMNPEVTAVCFAFITALSFNLWLNHPSFSRRLLAAVILGISSLVIIKGQGRMGLIAASCSVVVITALTLKFRKYPSGLFRKSLPKAVILISAILGGAWYQASISPYELTQRRVMSMFANPLQSEGLDLRIWLWKESINVFSKHPFGVGFGGFPSFLQISGNAWFAHNLYLYLVLSVGIIGFIGFLWIFIHYAKICWAGLHSDVIDRRILCIGGIGCLTVLFVGGIGSCVYESPWEVLMVWVPIGIIMARATLKDK